MALNKDDVEYRDNAKSRIKARFLIALIVGLFANWKWLLILIGAYAIGELFTMYKVLIHTASNGGKLELPAWIRGKLMGHALVSALAAMASTLAVAAIIKVVRDFVLSLF